MILGTEEIWRSFDNYSGSFNYEFKWLVSSEANGHIIQKIKRIEETDVETSPFVESRHQEVVEYWEAWPVINGEVCNGYGQVIPNSMAHDAWVGPAKTPPNLRGFIRMEADRYFSDETQINDMSVGGVQDAAACLSSYSQPNANITYMGSHAEQFNWNNELAQR